MKSWRHLLGLLPWLVAPSVFVGACGRTEHAGDQPSTAGKTSSGTASGGRPTNAMGGMGSTQPRAGAPNRGGTEPVLVGDAGYSAGPTFPPGLSDEPQIVDCPLDACFSSAVGPVYIDPCCAGDSCGLDTGFFALLGAKFPNQCQAKNQFGVLDSSCPTSASQVVPVQMGAQTISVPIQGFAGCCRGNGQCGVVVDNLVAPAFGVIGKLGLGCLDSAPFFGNRPALACGAAGEGAGGDSGLGGATSIGEGGVFSAGGAF